MSDTLVQDLFRTAMAHVMEMPQSGERTRSRDAMRLMQEAFPAPPQSMKIRWVVEAGYVWLLEGELSPDPRPDWGVVILG